MIDGLLREAVAIIVTIWLLFIASHFNLNLEVIILYAVIKLSVDVSSK